MRHFYLLFLPMLFIIACQHPEEPLTIESFKNLTEIPSASGVEVYDNEIWMVGDDNPFLFQYDKDLNLIQKYKISDADSMINNRVVKTQKADFESLAVFQNNLLILSSGSKTISRDTIFVFNLDKKQLKRKINVRTLYNQFLNIGNFDSLQQVNIEGLAYAKDHFFIINRGNIGHKNIIFKIEKEDFLSYLRESKIPDIETLNFSLPDIDAYESGFSGACFSKDGAYLFFTSSVEATRDVYQDGEVLGSFIGRINLTTNQINYWPLKKNDQFVKTKLESISIIEQKSDYVRLICTSDNDDGTSGVYHLKLNFKTDSYE